MDLGSSTDTVNVFKGSLLRISQTDTLLRLIAIANLDPLAENAIIGSWSPGLNGDTSWMSEMGIDMQVTKEKFVLFASLESK